MLAAGIVIAPLPLTTGASANQIASGLLSNLGAARSGGFLNLLATIPLIAFAGGIVEVLRRDDKVSRVLSRVAIGFAVAAAAIYAAAQSVLSFAASTAQGSAPETVRAVYGIWEAIGFTGHLFLGAFVLSVSVLALLARTLPGWIRWTGLVGSTCLIVGTLALSGGLDALGPLFLIGWYVSLIWLLITGVWAVLRKGATQPQPADPLPDRSVAVGHPSIQAR